MRSGTSWLSVLARATLLCMLLVVCVYGDEDVAASSSNGGGGVVEAMVSRGEPMSFQAEVAKMLDILVHSLYTNRNVFLRELISNASDALDKIRVLYLTKPKEPVNKDGEPVEMNIVITANVTSNQLVIRDGGIGMTKDDLVNHIGSLGSSGTKRFLEMLSQKRDDKDAVDSNLIGQFGVGFYSVFLVADRVRVASKSDESEVQYVWESTGDGVYYLYEDPRGNTLGRGTEITIDLKPDALEYAQPSLMRELVHQYSEFIHFPIYLVAPGPRPEDAMAADKTAPAVDANATQPGAASETEFVDGAGVRMHKVLLNKNRPIWTRPVSELTHTDYANFYRSISDDYRAPMYYSHFHVEGEVEFDSILFVPDNEPDVQYADELSSPRNIKLYVRRVFITDDFRSLLPYYLSFVKGIVDSNDLPLNVSREVLQESRILRVIRKKLVRKAIAMFADIADQDNAMEKRMRDANLTLAEVSRERDALVNESHTGTTILTTTMYSRFWKFYGRNIRRGVIEDVGNRGRLAKLLRFHSSHDPHQLTSLDAYVSRMKATQQGIYYLGGDSVTEVMHSPMYMDAVSRGIEVLILNEAIDSYVMTHLTEFQGKKTYDLARSSTVLEVPTAREKTLAKKRIERYKPLTSWLHKLYGTDNVEYVVVSQRNMREAMVCSSGDNRQTARMAKIIRTQTYSRDAQEAMYYRIVEINHRHPIIDELYRRVTVDAHDPVATDIAWVLYDTANMRNEFPMSNVSAYAERIDRLLRNGVDLPMDNELLPPDDDTYTFETHFDADGDTSVPTATTTTTTTTTTDEAATTAEDTTQQAETNTAGDDGNGTASTPAPATDGGDL